MNKLVKLPPATLIYCTHEYTLNNLRFADVIEPNNPQLLTRTQQVTQLRGLGQPSLPSTLLEELETNPFLRCHIAQVRQSVEAHTGFNLSNDVDVFRQLRLWKDSFR